MKMKDSLLEKALEEVKQDEDLLYLFSKAADDRITLTDTEEGTMYTFFVDQYEPFKEAMCKMLQDEIGLD